MAVAAAELGDAQAVGLDQARAPASFGTLDEPPHASIAPAGLVVDLDDDAARSSSGTPTAWKPNNTLGDMPRLSGLTRRHAAGLSPSARQRRLRSAARPARSAMRRSQRLRDLAVVSDQHQRRALPAAELEHQLHHLLAGREVEAAGRLVGQQQRGSIDEGARERDALLLAAREQARDSGRAVG